MILIPFIILLLINIFPIKNKKLNTLIFIGTIIFYLGFIYVRYGFGSDYFSYKAIYNSLAKTSITTALINFNIEPGFLFILLWGKRADLSFNEISLLINGITLIFFALWIWDMSKENKRNHSLFLFISMFFFVWVLSAYRQGLIMSIGLFLLYNHRFNFKLWQKILIVLALGLIHQSIYILIIYFILERFAKSQKIILIGMIIAIGISFVPIYNVLQLFSSFSFIRKISNYVSPGSNSIFDFASLLRLTFFAYFLYFYNYFKEESKAVFNLYIMNLIGYIIYFALSFSELTASRGTIYSFIGVVILLPYSFAYFKIELEKYVSIKAVKLVPVAMLTVVSSFFFVKEINTLKDQTGYVGSYFSLKVPTIYDENPLDFKTAYAFDDYIVKQSMANYSSFPTQDEYEGYTYKEGDYFTNVYITETQRYGVINQDGILVTEPDSRYNINVFGAFYEYIDVSNTYRNMYFKNIDPDFDGSKVEEVAKVQEEQILLDLQKVVVEPYEEADPASYQPAVDLLDTLGVEVYEIIDVATFSKPVDYRLVRVNIYNKNSFYIMIDKNNNVMGDTINQDFKRYDANGFARLKSGRIQYIYNLDGKLVWVEYN